MNLHLYLNGQGKASSNKNFLAKKQIGISMLKKGFQEETGLLIF